MTIDQIREQLAIKISQHENWVNKLDDSNPGHYGIEDWEVNLLPTDIWVDIPHQTFTFKKATFDFSATLGGSSDGISADFSKLASGKGTFEFGPKSGEVEVDELEVEFDLELFPEG